MTSHLPVCLPDLARAVVLDLEGKIVAWTAGAERMYGWVRSEAVGRSAEDLLKTKSSETFERIRAALLRDGEWSGELTQTRRDGAEIVVASHRILQRGGPPLIVEMGDDITHLRGAGAALRGSRALLENLIGSAMDAIIMVDERQRVVLLNAAAEKMFRRTAAEAAGQPLGNFIPARFRDAHAEHVREFGRTGVTARAMVGAKVVCGLRADGEEFPAEATISQAEAGGRKFYTVILRDVTERVRAEQQILRLNETLEQRVRERTARLEEVNAELESFSYSVSHDLRAPLRSIEGFSRALLEDYADRLGEEGADYLRRVRAATAHMGRLITDLLQLSRVTRGEMRRARVNLSELARSVVEGLRRRDPDRRVEVEVEDGLWAEGDERLLGDALENLLDNAWKFTSKHGGARIEFRAEGHGGETVYLVRDNGAGFDMAYADRLFGPFQRLHKEADFEGTGVGLATVRRIIRRHGGRVWAEGEVGRGATIFFTLREANGGCGGGFERRALKENGARADTVLSRNGAAAPDCFSSPSGEPRKL